VWQQVVATAEKYNEPGKFTTFIAYEWTSMPNGDNLHGNVIFRGTNVPATPFTAMDSVVPEHLWTFLGDQRAKGNDNIAISHNGNLSGGRMFRLVDSYGAPITAEYATRRNTNEPLHEAMQLKGTSMTHPDFSPEDEFADFELLPFSLHTWHRVQQQQTNFVREAYKFGLRFQETIGANPFKFGLEGGGDDHSSSHTWEEFNFQGGHAEVDNGALGFTGAQILVQENLLLVPPMFPRVIVLLVALSMAVRLTSRAGVQAGRQLPVWLAALFLGLLYGGALPAMQRPDGLSHIEQRLCLANTTVATDFAMGFTRLPLISLLLLLSAALVWPRRSRIAQHLDILLRTPVAHLVLLTSAVFLGGVGTGSFAGAQRNGKDNAA
jgi:hypothetical protein